MMIDGINDYNDENQQKLENLLIHAIVAGDLHTFKDLLGHIENINCANVLNETALLLAVKYAPKPAQNNMVRLLLDRIADPAVVSDLGETALDVARRDQNTDIIKLLHEQNISHLGLMPELWIEIGKFLDPEDLDNFRLVCGAFNGLLEKNSDVLWQPLLNRLHAIDSTIKTQPPKGVAIREAFISGFFKVKKRQEKEIAYFERNQIKHFCNKTVPITLEVLEYNSQQLDRINCDVIQRYIDDVRTVSADMGALPLTRLPRQILEGKNALFFKNLVHLRFSSPLHTLPDNIDYCTNLIRLHCDAGCALIELPSSIVNLSSLKTLSVFSNSLTSLPKGFGNLINLEVLDVSENKLETLPKDIGNLSKLEELECEKNFLKALPESLLKILPNLESYDFSNNYFYDKDDSSNINGRDSRWYISFLISKSKSQFESEEDKEFFNDTRIWHPLFEILHSIYPLLSAIPLTDSSSLRDQFVERFNRMANRQLHALLTLSTDENQLAKYNILKDATTGEFAFEVLTLDQLDKNEIFLDLNNTFAQNEDNAIELMSPINGVYFLRDTTQYLSDEEPSSDSMDIEQLNVHPKVRR